MEPGREPLLEITSQHETLLANLALRSRYLRQALEACAVHQTWRVKQEENAALLESHPAQPSPTPVPGLSGGMDLSATAGHGVHSVAPATRQVLFHVHTTRPEDSSACVPPAYAAAARRAMANLGLDAELAGMGGSSAAVLARAADWAVVTGMMRHVVLGVDGTSQDTAALYQQMLTGPSAPIRGAAYECLAALLSRARGDDPAPPAPSPLCPALQAGPAPGPVPELPTLADLAEALGVQGYRFGTPAGPPPAGPPPDALQLYTVKLLLALAAATARGTPRHGRCKPKDVAAWVEICCALRTDPAADALHGTLDDALPALLSAMTEKQWRRELTGCILVAARRLVRAAPGPAACLDMLRMLPGCPRGRALRLQVCARLLPRLIPAAAVATDMADVATPEALLRRQTWFRAPRGLVEGAVSGDAPLQGPDAYGMHALEQVLTTCDILVWPAALAGELDPTFMPEWLAFLVGIQRGIRAMLPEDQAVKVLATHLELEYRALGHPVGSTNG